MNKLKKNLCILVVEDQEDFRETMVDELSHLGFDTLEAKDGQEGFEIASSTSIDLILSDIRMPNKDGEWFLAELQKTKTTFPTFLFMTGFSNLSLQDVYAMGASGILGKPLSPENLDTVLTKLCRPLQSRWSERPTQLPIQHISKNFPCSLDDNQQMEINFGRGGVFLSIQKCDLNIGDVISFHLQFTGGPLQSLEGIGHVVWKVCGLESAPNEYGIYFDYISPSTLPAWLNYLNTKKINEVIPKKKRGGMH